MLGLQQFWRFPHFSNFPQISFCSDFLLLFYLKSFDNNEEERESVNDWVTVDVGVYSSSLLWLRAIRRLVFTERLSRPYNSVFIIHKWFLQNISFLSQLVSQCEVLSCRRCFVEVRLSITKFDTMCCLSESFNINNHCTSKFYSHIL